MDKDEMRSVMTIIRPAIWALYGRQKLRLSGYAMVDLFGSFIELGWFEVEGNGWHYKLKIVKNTVAHLTVGELNV